MTERTIPCPQCRVPVPESALADPNRCISKYCPLKPAAAKEAA